MRIILSQVVVSLSHYQLVVLVKVCIFDGILKFFKLIFSKKFVTLDLGRIFFCTPRVSYISVMYSSRLQSSYG